MWGELLVAASAKPTGLASSRATECSTDMPPALVRERPVRDVTLGMAYVLNSISHACSISAEVASVRFGSYAVQQLNWAHGSPAQVRRHF